ncbi:helix-turn-helix domain-containing protein [Photobacterium sp. ZSDE20]|uniref:Helix-turn-helix domain-containing protein n=1 Tax=Photobacterium pectinilyticum TaxID=2906793 RepID=A0ABT1ND44_9GAMM|nr:helix-turn-helix transcriptional regulator [Photobacterium sp. ZSDE20]MCQ1061254.1 helix-turn-helix domain-containing protein [Photobacterium sp. ZSDE20]MDD1829732.1 helix-turn-helix domain-containing protein [Photobacterium sp. ZSDE20]
MEIKDRLVSMRKKTGRTQQQIAEELEISLTAYKKYESGSGFPTMENLIKIADALEISIDELCGRWETNKDQELMIRMKKIKTLDEQEKEVINTILESMLIRHATKSIIMGT